MTRDRKFRILCAASFLLALLGVGCAGQIDSGVEGDLDSETAAGAAASLTLQSPPAVPAALVVPTGNRLAFAYDAEGEQVYECRVDAAGAYAWVFKEPVADLLMQRSHRLVGSHYVGPTWEHLDGSLVVGAKVAGAAVDATAIPWLLLSATSHTGEGRMEHVSFIQRLSTVGGLAPSGGCDAAHVTQLKGVDYTATYYFFVPSNAHCK
jgi:hypothetical protein